jgi:cytochrome c oxidase assembly protein subunit 15
VGWVTVVIGVIVTGAGPHAGDAATPRNGFDLEVWQHYHSWPAYITTGLVGVALLSVWLKLGKDKLKNPAVKALGILFLNLILQAILGVVQSNLGVPALMAGAHMCGAAVIIALLTFQLLALRSKYQRSVQL